MKRIDEQQMDLSACLSGCLVDAGRFHGIREGFVSMVQDILLFRTLPSSFLSDSDGHWLDSAHLCDILSMQLKLEPSQGASEDHAFNPGA